MPLSVLRQMTSPVCLLSAASAPAMSPLASTPPQPAAHWLLHAHFLLSGCLFAHVIAGPDPAPSRPTVRARLVHLGVAIAAAWLIRRWPMPATCCARTPRSSSACACQLSSRPIISTVNRNDRISSTYERQLVRRVLTDRDDPAGELISAQGMAVYRLLQGGSLDEVDRLIAQLPPPVQEEMAQVSPRTHIHGLRAQVLGITVGGSGATLETKVTKDLARWQARYDPGQSVEESPAGTFVTRSLIPLGHSTSIAEASVSAPRPKVRPAAKESPAP